MIMDFMYRCKRNPEETIANYAGYITPGEECPTPVSYNEWRRRIIEEAYAKVRTMQCCRFYVMGGSIWTLDEYLSSEEVKNETDEYVTTVLDMLETAREEYDPEYYLVE